MASLVETKHERQTKMIFYADDMAILTGAARKETAIRKLENVFMKAKIWADAHGLEFSTSQSQTMSIKGGLKPNFTVKFGYQ